MDVSELAKQVPSLLVLTFVVLRFLGYMKARDEQMLKHDTGRDARLIETLAHIGNDCHIVQRDSIKVMGEVREELGRTREVGGQLLTHLKRRGQNVADRGE